MSPVVRGAGLVYAREGRRILDGVDVEVAAGERVAVTGPSGAGKTTLLTLLAGLERPDAGTVVVAGLDPTDAEPVELRRRVGLVLQGYGLVSLLTAEENVELVLRDAGVPDQEVDDRVRTALAEVGLADRADHLVEELSGGEQQRVAVARALVASPQVLFADEPTAALDAATRGHVLQLVLGMADRGIAVVLATHDPAVAAQCDRELHVHAGRLEERGVLEA